MRISELAEATGVPVHTLKYYLREGLLQSGVATGRTSADYGTEHVDRVRLVRALIEVGGIGIAGVHAILTALDTPITSQHSFLGAAHAALPMTGMDEPLTDEVVGLLGGLGWAVDPASPPARALGVAIEGARRAGVLVDRERLQAYAVLMREVALLDIVKVDEAMATGGPGAALRMVVIGNVMIDPVLIALRRVAQEAASAAREQE
ncbi:MAG: MerR family transcriptional regulator [Propionibacteriaceae bacterium]|nr:MerR family transcriptional regulator [Propionibacteriaceae bacterium]